MIKKYILTSMILSSLLYSSELDGKKVFETYCWGCHHQTAMAFGPPFNQIASKRTKVEILAYITSPKSMYKQFGYKRTVMTQFHLSNKEKNLVADYILSFKGKK
jgi:mono/diheme cytochrome c family protein